jgi:hypothetical protein
LAPERVVVITAPEEEPEPVVPPQASPTAPSTLGALQQQLLELRQQLEGFRIEGLQLDPPSNGETDAHPNLEADLG